MPVLRRYISGHNYSNRLLNTIYNNVGMFDFVLQGDLKSVHAHKLILAGSSKYFKNMFAKDPSITELNVSHFDGDALKKCIDFCYTGQIDFTTDNIYRIIEISKDFQFQEINKEGWKVLSEITSIDCKNVFEIIEFAETRSNQNVVRNCLKFLIKNIREIAKLSDFQKLKKERILNYMKQAKNQSLGTDVEVMNVFKSWIAANSKEKEMYFSEFLACFDLKNVPMEIMYDTKKGDKIKLSTLDYINFCCILNEKLVAFTKHGKILQYKFNNCKWKSVGKIKIDDGFSLTVLGNSLYAFGRFQYNLPMKYDFKTKKWTVLSKPSEGRCSLILVFCRGNLYAFGGKNYERNRLEISKTVEKYDPDKNQWTTLPEWSYPKLPLCATVEQDNIFLITEGDDIVTYNTINNKIVMLTNLKKKLDCDSFDFIYS